MSNKYLPVFEKFVPGEAAPYCLKLYDHFGFEFKIKKARLTKLGDYRFDPTTGRHTITVNNDLNPFAFLITYLHEVAHLVTHDEYRRRVKPHGKEWKSNFKKVCEPVVTSEIFPDPVLLSMNSYLVNPKASSCSDPILFQVLRQFNSPNGQVLLKTLQPGDIFVFQQNRYRYDEKKRTRVICSRIPSGKKYLISQLAEVEKIEE